MTKIPFTLEAWLKDKSQKVVNSHNGKEVHLLEYDLRPANSFKPMIGYEESGCENLRYAESDLFIVTPEEEMTGWQRFISACLQKHGLLDCGAADRIAKECSAELLFLAREELFANDSVLKEYVQVSREQGKTEALKDLPKWKKANGKERFNERLIVIADDNVLLCTNYAEEGEYYISFSDLEKLSGFKED